LSPALRVTRALAASFLPCGYAVEDGPVDRTTIDCACAAVATSANAAPAPVARAIRRAVVLAENIALSFACRAQPFEQVAQGVVLPGSGEFGCESLHKRGIARGVRLDKVVYHGALILREVGHHFEHVNRGRAAA